MHHVTVSAADTSTFNPSDLTEFREELASSYRAYL